MKCVGGAIYGGSARNCIFLSNSAKTGKDTFDASIEACIFAESATFRVFDFITVPYSGEKQMVNLIGNGGELLNNVPVTVKITKDGVVEHKGESGCVGANALLKDYHVEICEDYFQCLSIFWHIL